MQKFKEFEQTGKTMSKITTEIEKLLEENKIDHSKATSVLDERPPVEGDEKSIYTDIDFTFPIEIKNKQYKIILNFSYQLYAEPCLVFVGKGHKDNSLSILYCVKEIELDEDKIVYTQTYEENITREGTIGYRHSNKFHNRIRKMIIDWVYICVVDTVLRARKE